MVRLAPHQRLHADPDLVRGLPDRIGGRDRAVDQRSEPTDRRGADERAAQRTDAGARQLRLAAKTLQPAGGALARGLDALQALLAVRLGPLWELGGCELTKTAGGIGSANHNMPPD